MKTIFALASPIGHRSAISVFRLSGIECTSIWKSLSGQHYLPTPRRATLVELKDPRSNLHLDKCIAIYFKGPSSFSGEDMLEFHVHGSRAVQEGLADALLAMPNVCMADAGEFSRRAFENGKLSLTEVEALSDLICSETAAQREQALQQLGGGLRHLYEKWRAELILLLARVEAVIDFADDELIEEEVYHDVAPRVELLLKQLQNHLQDERRGELTRQGKTLAITGPPNSGKSSLFNTLLGRKAAIVSPKPGTTRDVLESTLDIGGHAVRLADTAGLRETVDDIEMEGIKRALEQAMDAQMRLVVVDISEASVSLPPLLARLEKRPSLIVLNKADLLSEHLTKKILSETENTWSVPAVAVSCLEPELPHAPFQGLVTVLASQLGPIVHEALALTRPRHRVHLQTAAESLSRFSVAFVQGPELAAEELRTSVRELGSLSGHVTVEDVLDVLFAEFCIGK